ncbi:hypothetical protein F0562_028536 [Nyssa sinensis]|uniref:Uncharacterized protein n=1 Tax=Nyssa sinensis TaxID=561372 RepID=A0A5J5B0J0_9ASTE|nr:hypothetical protein F0562_028536 [Nyssa sinensis]
MDKACRASTDLIFEADDEDLSTWEIINPSDDDEDEDLFSFDEDDGDVYKDLDVDDGGFGSLSSDLSTQSMSDHLNNDHFNDHDVRVDDGFGSLSSDLSAQSLADHLKNDHFSDHDARLDLIEDESSDDHDEDDDYDEEEEGYFDEYDLNDELVPKSVSDRFGGQRLRKLGKRAVLAAGNYVVIACFKNYVSKFENGRFDL